jgi:hypothetical protein
MGVYWVGGRNIGKENAQTSPTSEYLDHTHISPGDLADFRT